MKVNAVPVPVAALAEVEKPVADESQRLPANDRVVPPSVVNDVNDVPGVAVDADPLRWLVKKVPPDAKRDVYSSVSHPLLEPVHELLNDEEKTVSALSRNVLSR